MGLPWPWTSAEGSGTRRNSAGEVMFLAGRVFQRQGFRGFVQFDVGGELGHGLSSDMGGTL